jgi:hypothetical protein
LVEARGLFPGHVTLHLLNVTDNLVGNLPITCEFVAVRGPGGLRGLETLHKGLAIDDEGDLLSWRCEGFYHEESHVFRTHRGAWVSVRDGHAGRLGAAICRDLENCSGCDRKVRVVDVLAGSVAIEWPAGVPLKVGHVHFVAVVRDP